MSREAFERTYGKDKTDFSDVYKRQVQHGGAVVPVDLSVYDTNGNEGIPVPGSEELNAVKEIAANMGAGMGLSLIHI